MLGILLAIILLIVYGSLYPWHFAARELPASPLYLLLHSWQLATGRRAIADIVLNVAIYVPQGMSGYLAFRRFRWTGPILLGASLSACIEMAQLYTPGRQCSAVDLTTNIAGSALGVMAGRMFESMSGTIRPNLRRAADPSALALLYCWFASMLFPLFPDTSLPDWRHKALAFVHGPWLSPVSLISAAASWFAVATLLRRTTLRRPGAWLIASLTLIPAQILIATRQPAPVQLAGAAAGITVFLLFHRRMSAIPAWGFLGVLAIRGLAPFQPVALARHFGWIPFAGFLGAEWQYAIPILLEKLFDYGAAIWLLRDSGLRWSAAIGPVCAVLAVIEVAQIHLPGRTPEITDPLLGLLAGLGLIAIGKRRVIGYHAIS